MFNIYAIIMIIATFFNAISQVLLKKSAVKTKNVKFIKKFLNKTVFISYLIFAIVCLVNIIAYRGVDFKYGGAINAVGQIFVIILSYIFCKEQLSKDRIIGSSLIIIGVIVYSLQ